jgi:Flp pilus assembly protein TadD
MNKSFYILGISVLPIANAFAQDTPAAPPASVPSIASPAPAAPVPAKPAVPTPAAPEASSTDSAETLRQATLAYNSGMAALKRSDWGTAAQNFGKAAALSPTDAGAFSLLGYVRLQQKDWDGALQALQTAQDNGKNLDNQARAQLLNNIGFARWNKGDYADAKTAFESALALQNDYYDARYNLAFAMISRDEHAAALPHLRQLATANPQDAAIQEGLGEAFEKTGNQGSALGAYKRAIALDQKNESYRFKFALLLLAGDRRDEAIVQLRELLAINPNSAPALLQLGDLHLRSNRWSEAIAALRRYTALRRTDFTGYFNLGVAYDYSSKFKEALEQYAEAEKINANDAATKNNVGRIYFKQGKFADAITKFNEALALDPNFYDARTNLAIVLTSQENYAESNVQWQLLANAAEQGARTATRVFERRQMEGRLSTARSGLAFNYLALEKPELAAVEYRKLLASNPNDVEARSGLGRALFLQKDYTGAEAAYRAVIAANPKNANAYNDLGVVLEAKNNRKDALENYAQALAIEPGHTEAQSNLNRLQGKATST